MKKILILITISLLSFSCSKDFFSFFKSQEERPSNDFVQGSEDIPLIIGMKKLPDESVGFDSDAGSIISSSYETKDNLSNVREFYLKTLPKLGWKVNKKNRAKVIFSRENEKLEIEFNKEKKSHVVRFFISTAL